MTREQLYAYLQAAVTVGVLGVWLYLTVTGQAVPETLDALAVGIVGYFIGSQVGERAVSRLRR